MGDLQGRGTIHGVVRSGGGGGVTDYNDLTNRPSINNHILTGSKTGHDYGLANLEDVLIKEINPTITPGVIYPRLEYIKDKNNNIYKVLYPPFTGAISGLVPQAPEPSGKVLNDSGGWVELPQSGAICEILPITNGDGSTSRTFHFDKQPKLLKIFHKSISLSFFSDMTIVWGQDFYTYPSHGTYIEISGGSVPSGTITYNNNDITFTAGNAFGAFNVIDSTGYILVIY